MVTVKVNQRVVRPPTTTSSATKTNGRRGERERDGGGWDAITNFLFALKTKAEHAEEEKRRGGRGGAVKGSLIEQFAQLLLPPSVGPRSTPGQIEGRTDGAVTCGTLNGRRRRRAERSARHMPDYRVGNGNRETD